MIRIFSEKEVTDVTVVPDDFFVKFVKKYYFPFQQRFHRHICIGWLIVFVICIVYGPAFLSSTKNSLDLPASAPSVQAINVYAQYFPNSGNKPPAIIIQETKGLQSNIINDYTKNFSTALNQYASKHKDVVSFVSGYWEMIDVQDEEIIAQQSVSKSNSTMKSTVYFTKQSSIAQSNDFVKTLIDFTVQQSNSQNYVATTGLSALFYEMQLSTSTSFELIDATVIPLAILILGANLQSYRHMLIAFCNLGCTLLLAFALLMPVTYIFDINPFSPSIMLSLGVAVSFDYSLFMLNRFREEIIEKRNSRQYAVLSCVCMAGHVVCLSGCILLFTFVLLITFPQNFLQSVGISCAAVVFAALLTNMSLTPALLLTFECFSFFDFCPSRESVCCYMSPEYKASHLRDYQNTDNTGVKVLNATKSVEDPSEERKEADFTQDSGNSNGLVVSETRDDLGDVELSTPTGGGGVSNSVSSNANANINMTTASGDMANTSSYEELKSNDESVQAPESAPEPSFGVSSESVHRNTLSAWCGPDEVSSLEPQAGQMIYEEPVCDRQKSLFFRCSYAISEHPWLVLFLSAVITAPLLWQVFSLVPTSDNGLIYLPGSRSLDAYNVLKAQYPIGLVDPYSILVVTGTANTIYTEDYFQFETGLISDLLTTSTQYLSTQSLTGVSYCNGHNVSYELAMEYRNTSSSLYHTKDASTYRGLTNGLVNTDQSVTIIQVNTIVDPDSQAISQFIVNTRSLLKSYSAANPLPTGTTTMYLFGGFTTTYDLQQIVYALVPVMVAVTFIAVMLLIGLGFGSVFLTLRLLLTVGMSLSWAYGLMVIVYQPGPGQTGFSVLTPSLTRSTGIYWIIPIMSFSILVGLALDYDIFLMTRMMEFRRLGWSDRASICLAIQKTGYIITTAGLIMSISFAGLLIPPTIVLNQYGFALFLGVAIDTFVIRTILMPAVIAAFGTHTNVFWWPTRMPPVILSLEQEQDALWKGHWNPQRFIQEANVVTDDVEKGQLNKTGDSSVNASKSQIEFTNVTSFNGVENVHVENVNSVADE